MPHIPSTKANRSILLALGKTPGVSANELLNDLRSDEALQNIRIVGDDLDNRSDIGKVINCASAAGVHSYYQGKHIDMSIYDSRDIIKNSSGGLFSMPVYQNADFDDMPKVEFRVILRS